MIREADLSDLPRLCAMAEAFHDASGVPLPYDAARVDAALRALLATDAGRGWVYVRAGRVEGMLLAVVTPTLFGPGLLAEELAFWIEPEARGGSAARRLIAVYAAWAKAAGARVAGLVDPGGCAPLYRRLGYRPAETRWVRAL